MTAVICECATAIAMRFCSSRDVNFSIVFLAGRRERHLFAADENKSLIRLLFGEPILHYEPNPSVPSVMGDYGGFVEVRPTGVTRLIDVACGCVLGAFKLDLYKQQ